MHVGQGLADAGHAQHDAPAAAYDGDGLADLGLFLGREVTEIGLDPSIRRRTRRISSWEDMASLRAQSSAANADISGRCRRTGAKCAHFCKVVCMTETTYSIVEARARLGAIAREVSATREPVAITDHGQTVAILVSPADALELQELRALAAYRARQARGENAGVSHDEAYRRVFGGAEA